MAGILTRLSAIAEAVRAIVGVPSYARYLDHMTRHHPDRPAMSEAEFFRDRQDARYRGGGGRCC